jgi:hypothetical protein
LPTPAVPDVWQITEIISKFFAENPNELVYCGEFDVDGNSKVRSCNPSLARVAPTNNSICRLQILSYAATYGRNNGKAIYAFSVDREGGKVAHTNYVPKEILAEKKIDGKKWLAEVSKVLGGKVSAKSLADAIIARRWPQARTQLTGCFHGRAAAKTSPVPVSGCTLTSCPRAWRRHGDGLKRTYRSLLACGRLIASGMWWRAPLPI